MLLSDVILRNICFSDVQKKYSLIFFRRNFPMIGNNSEFKYLGEKSATEVFTIFSLKNPLTLNYIMYPSDRHLSIECPGCVKDFFLKKCFSHLHYNI